MTTFIMRMSDGAAGAACAVCGHAVPPRAGPQLCVSETLAAVCGGCGRKHAPALTALIDLARVAERVGHASRRNPLRLPVAMLLEMTRISEDFCTSLAPEGRAV